VLLGRRVGETSPTSLPGTPKTTVPTRPQFAPLVAKSPGSLARRRVRRLVPARRRSPGPARVGGARSRRRRTPARHAISLSSSSSTTRATARFIRYRGGGLSASRCCTLEVPNGYISPYSALLLAPQRQLPIRLISRHFVSWRVVARTPVFVLESLVMKGSAVRVRSSASGICRDFLRAAFGGTSARYETGTCVAVKGSPGEPASSGWATPR